MNESVGGTNHIFYVPALAAAISNLYHGNSNFYQGFYYVFQNMVSANIVFHHEVTPEFFMSYWPTVDYDAVIAAGVSAAPSGAPADMLPVYMPDIDIGLIDFYYWAFRLFGPNTSSFATLYLSIVGASCSLAAVQFRHQPTAILIIVGYLTGLLLWLNSHLFLGDAYIWNLWDYRIIQSFSYVSVTHVGVFLGSVALGHRRVTLLDAIVLLGAIAILALGIGTRSSLTWAVLSYGGILAIGAIAVLLGRVGRRAIFDGALAVAVLIAALGGMFALRWSVADEVYRSGHQMLVGGPTWHRVYLAFALDTETWMKRKMPNQLAGTSDSNSYFAAEAVFKETNTGDYFWEVFPRNVSTQWPLTNMKWNEELMKTATMRYILADVPYALGWYLWRKPLMLIPIIAGDIRSVWLKNLESVSSPAVAINLVVLVSAIVSAGMLAWRRAPIAGHVLAAIVMLAFAFTPHWAVTYGKQNSTPVLMFALALMPVILALILGAILSAGRPVQLKSTPDGDEAR